MDFDLSDEQKMLAEQVRRLLSEQSPPNRLRLLIDKGLQWDAELWQALADMGVLGAAIPEEYGGLGFSYLDLCVVAEEIGRAGASVPFSSSIGYAAEALRALGSEAQKANWLPKMASGETIAALAYAEGASDVWSDLPQAHFENGRVSGLKWPVADLAIAQIALVACVADGKPAFALVELDGDGIRRDPLNSFDQLRGHGRLLLDGALAELLPASDEGLLQTLLDRFAVFTAFEQIGGAEACLYMARDYALERRIFSRLLASYQAIKHKLADVFVGVELARSSAYFAGWAAVNEEPELQAAAAAARLAASEAFEAAARDNLQIHGGIGYTFEADCHFYYRRERLLALILGSRPRWSARLLNALPEIAEIAAQPA
jgi:acyl-CoA dehydrogenase